MPVLTRFLDASVNTGNDAVSAFGLTVPFKIVVLVPVPEPILMLVGPPDEFVPILTVLVPLGFAPLAILTIWDPVDCPSVIVPDDDTAV